MLANSGTVDLRGSGMTRILGNGRYANVTATMALVVALGGSAYAANTVRSKDIKNGEVQRVDLANNAVTSGKVRNGTLLSKDFKRGQIPAGQKGAPGAPGATGPKGDTGPSDVFQAFRNTISPPPLPDDATTTLVTLPLAAGRYVIFGKLDFDGGGTMTCRLRAGDDSDRVLASAAGVGGWNCNMQLVHEFSAAGTAILEIDTPPGAGARAGDAKVTAIRVGSLSNVAVTG
jgi:hypothetical protein